MIRLLFVAVFGFALVACFQQPKPECAFFCAVEDQACPQGYACAPDGICKRDDVAPDFVCQNISREDAAQPAIDAPPGGDGDAAAPVDGAAPDAAVPDAAVPDAAVPDAAVPDAAVPDAATPDAKPELDGAIGPA